MAEGARLYEGMFLINPGAVNASVATATQVVKEVLDRVGAELEAIYKWDDRKLAYPIDQQKRGLYLLAYFRVDGGQIARIENQVHYSDRVMRCLIIRADHIGQTELDLARQKQQETIDAAALAGGGEKPSDG